ncbi:hypothetical protein KJY77_05790 [Canibacter sp. lx-72]|uniref:hypothetical protein n=1 Tax=Canibacter zhuwentaonis TaxID=2837491 RepID=UPI001BDCC14D|nr:hypothetical protein [Canibacter zhuwentaonis]MBT1018641.1 hypothetical protein [Canibacter zhuwentaonis]
MRNFQLNSTLGTQFNENDFYDRATALHPLVGFLIAGGLGVVYVWHRRLQFASMLRAGARRENLLTMPGLEISWWIAPVIALAFLCSVIFCVVTKPFEGVYMLLGLRTILPAVAGFYCGALLYCGMIRERQLFKLFKNR